MNKYSLIKHFSISCAHSIPGAGKCERIHGHNYKIVFKITGNKLNEQGMLIDFRELKKNIEKKYDHQLLNEFEEFKAIPPSTERFSEVIYNEIVSICGKYNNILRVEWVEVHETDEATAIFMKEGQENGRK